jgi:hypothetical protein
MPRAAFESEPQAEAAAGVLREMGYESRVVVRTSGEDGDFAKRTTEFFAGKFAPFEPHALVISDDAEAEPFTRTVQRHYGIVVSTPDT